ncbi:hypothetical protein HG530_001694 [Fusarium avenaceum]|nr:hypothetical protein HG530_001694 [Fusarium avenaceum]
MGRQLLGESLTGNLVPPGSLPRRKLAYESVDSGLVKRLIDVELAAVWIQVGELDLVSPWGVTGPGPNAVPEALLLLLLSHCPDTIGGCALHPGVATVAIPALELVCFVGPPPHDPPNLAIQSRTWFCDCDGFFLHGQADVGILRISAFPGWALDELHSRLIKIILRRESAGTHFLHLGGYHGLERLKVQYSPDGAMIGLLPARLVVDAPPQDLALESRAGKREVDA